MTFSTDNLARSSAIGAGLFSRTGFLPESGTDPARIRSHSVDSRSASFDGLLEADGNRVLQILPTLRFPRLGSFCLTKNVAEVRLARLSEVESLKTETPGLIG